MYRQNKDSAEKRSRKGLVSHFLWDRIRSDKTKLAITWVEVEPGARQRPHHHEPEQVYVIVQGKGKMEVAGETAVVTAGDLVHIPSNATHGIVNTGAELLVYVSAATPPFDLTEAYDRGQLREQNY